MTPRLNVSACTLSGPTSPLIDAGREDGARIDGDLRSELLADGRRGLALDERLHDEREQDRDRADEQCEQHHQANQPSDQHATSSSN